MSYILPQLKKINNVIQKEFNCMVCELYLNKCVGQKTKPKKKKKNNPLGSVARQTWP